MFKQGNSSFLEGNSPSHPSICVSSSSSDLWVCAGGIWSPQLQEWWVWHSRRGWQRSPRKECWKSRCMEIPGGCLIPSVPPMDQALPQKFAGLKLYQNHPQVHPSQSFPQPHPACLSFIDKKTRKKEDFHRKLIITFSPPPLIFWHKCIRYSLQI